MGALVPTVVDAVDPDALIDRLDVDALMERVDVDALITRVDLDALLTRIDIDALLGRIDIDALLGRIDVGALIARMDMNEVIGQVDMNAVIGQVDLNALLDGVDIKAIVAKAGIDEIVAEASTGVLTRTLDLARRQLVGIDIIIMGAVDRVFRRQRPALPDTPKLSATGRSAGPISRTIAFGFDLFFVSVLFGMVAYLGRSLVELFTGDIVHPTRGAGIAWTIGYFLWFGMYLWGSIEIAGRTPGKALVGLRVVGLDGEPLGPGRALVRTLVFPFSFILGLGFIPAVTRKDRRALHELVAGSKEIVDWGDRDAGIPSALEGWVGRQRDAQVIALTTAATAATAGASPQTATVAVELEIVPEAESDGDVVAIEPEEGEVDEDGEVLAAMDDGPVLTEPVDPEQLVDEASTSDEDEADYWAG